jgi:rhamnulokinase
MASHNYLAFDLGAESGRAIHGSLTNGKLQLTEVGRFPNGCLNIRGRYHWDIFRIFDEMKKSLENCVVSKKLTIESLAIDTWGVDFGLLAKDGSLLSMPFTYRDHQTDGMVDKFDHEVMTRAELYKRTGIQLMQFNTIFQLYAMRREKSPLLGIATDLLFTPDLLNYLFTGVKKSEFTIATTSQLLNPLKREWDNVLFEAIGIASDIMHSILYPGTIVGNIDNAISNHLVLKDIPLIAVASHDTASAIAAIPADDKPWAFLSSGTWSLMGIEVDQPIINKRSAELDFSNEGGVEGKYSFMKNLGGLLLLQQCKKSWDATHCYSYEQLTKMAEGITPFKTFVDTDAPEFYNPDDMPKAIIDYCKKSKQSVPANHAEFTRCIFDSLAMKYRSIMNQLNEFSLKSIEKLFVIGGGAKNKLLCQSTANALGIPVITGTSEATAVGNIMLQAKALGHVSSLDEIRTISRNSFESESFVPQDREIWDKEFERYLKIVHP